VGELQEAESGMRLFKQWILKRIFKPNKKKISGVWKKTA
jgi:hypothetical protein